MAGAGYDNVHQRIVLSFQVRGMCFGHWNGDQGAVRWARSFGTPRRGTLLVQFCQEVLQWYPAFAGRYVKDWNQAYVPCQQRELESQRSVLHRVGGVKCLQRRDWQRDAVTVARRGRGP